MSATPATQNEGGCEIVPHLPRKMPRRHGRHGATKPTPSAPLSAMSATPATRNEGGCEIVPRLPRKTKVDVRLWWDCAICATPARQNDGRCEFVPRLPRKMPRLCVCVKLLYVKFVCLNSAFVYVCVDHLNRCKTSIRFWCTTCLIQLFINLFFNVYAGGQCTTDRHCPTKTLSVRGDTEPDQLCVPASIFVYVNGNRPSQEPACRFFKQFPFGVTSTYWWLSCIRTFLWART